MRQVEPRAVRQAAVGAALAGGLLWLSPGRLNAEGWSAVDPLWVQAAGCLVLLYGGMLCLLAQNLPTAGRRFAAPLVWAAPAMMLKPTLTDLDGLRAAGLPFALGQLAAATFIATVVATMLLPEKRRAMTKVSLPIAFVGLLLFPALRFGERYQQEEVIASGRVESLLRELADRVGDAALETPPGADGGHWLREVVRAPGWDEIDGRWFWRPAEGVAPGPIQLDYHPPRPGGSAWDVLLTARPVPLIHPDARRFTAEITIDGGLAWEWPAGPPPAVAARGGE